MQGAYNTMMGKQITMQHRSAFLEVFGDSPVLRAMDFLIVNDGLDYSMTDIAVHSGVGYTTLKAFWKKLVKGKVVAQTRIIGKAKLYKLNRQNPAVACLIKLYWATTKKQVDRLVAEKVIVRRIQTF